MSNEITRLWDRMAAGWAAGSGAEFAAVFSQDTEFVNVRGEEQRGRDTVAAGHQALFDTRYRGTTLTADVRSIRFITEHAAVVHVASTVHTADGRAIGTHAQAVVERRDGEWLISAFHNMIPAN